MALIMSAVVLSGCRETKPDKDDSSVKKVSAYVVTKVGLDSQIVYESESNLSGDNTCHNVYEYDEKGNISICSKYINDMLTDTVYYEYSSDGMPARIGTREGVEDRYTEFSPLENNVQNYNEWFLREFGNVNMGYGTYEYDSKGRIVKMVCRAEDAAMEGYYQYIYDSKDRLSKVEAYISFKGKEYELDSAVTYKYDEEGKLQGVLWDDGYEISVVYEEGNRALTPESLQTEDFEYKEIEIDSDRFIKVQNQQIMEFARYFYRM